MWSAIKMWKFLRYIKSIEGRYDKLSGNYRVVEGTPDDENFQFAKAEVAKMSMAMGTTGFTSIPRIHLTLEYAKSEGIEDRKKVQKIIDMCLDAKFLERAGENLQLPMLKLTVKGEKFSSLDPLYFFGFLLKEYSDIQKFIIGGGGVALAWLITHFWHLLQ